MAIERIERVIDDGRRETMVADTLRADVITEPVDVVVIDAREHVSEPRLRIHVYMTAARSPPAVETGEQP
jgi:hypothetical protein